MPVLHADPESMPANDWAHEFSETDAHACVDSGSALEFGPVVFVEPQDVSDVP